MEVLVRELNLCEELIKEMVKLEFSEVSINWMRSQSGYAEAWNKEERIQKSLLTMTLFNLLMQSESVVPSQIRLALNIASDVVAWLDDIKLAVLPFMKANEEKFFPVVNYPSLKGGTCEG